jgi:hypothetical protein
VGGRRHALAQILVTTAEERDLVVGRQEIHLLLYVAILAARTAVESVRYEDSQLRQANSLMRATVSA